MDNNPVSQTPISSPAPVTPTPGGENKMILWLIVGLVIVVLAVGGFYLLMIRSQQTGTPAIPSPSPAQENLESDLNSINIEDIESDFATVDQDLQNL